MPPRLTFCRLPAPATASTCLTAAERRGCRHEMPRHKSRVLAASYNEHRNGKHSCRRMARASGTPQHNPPAMGSPRQCRGGDVTIKPVTAAVFDVNETDRARVDAMCTPHPIASLTDKVIATGARERIANKTYIRAKGYPSTP